MQLGKLSVCGKAWLAPMAGVSDVAFRALCVKHGAAVAPIEFLSANALARQNPVTMQMARVADEETVRIIQIFGQNEANIAKTVQWIDAQGCYDCIDINLGCPSPKILLQGAGSALLRRPDKVVGIFRAIVSHTTLPFSIKLRTGMTAHDRVGMDIIATAVEFGVNHVAIHGRSVKQGYSGASDWQFIREAVERFSVPIIANGDVVDGSSAAACLNQTGCAAVMVGRAARGNPFVFRDINGFLEDGSRYEATFEEKAAVFFDYLDLYKKYKMDDYAVLKSHAMQFTKGLRGGALLRQEITRLRDVAALETFMSGALQCN